VTADRTEAIKDQMASPDVSWADDRRAVMWLLAEVDRLRTVVDAVRDMKRTGIESTPAVRVRLDSIYALYAALDALDGTDG
jgi:hypothetical protein